MPNVGFKGLLDMLADHVKTWTTVSPHIFSGLLASRNMPVKEGSSG